MTAVIITSIFLVVIGAICVFLVLPRITDSADMELQSSDYARGGLWGKGVPENSFPAIRGAVTAGYGVELDVTLSKDGKAMALRPDAAEKLLGLKNDPSLYTAEQLRSIRLGGTKCSVPMLSHILDMIDGQVSVMIRIEASDRIGFLCRAVTRILDSYDGAFAIVSSNTDILVWFRKYRPRFARGFILLPYKDLRKKSRAKHPALSSFALANMLTNFMCRPDFISADGSRRRSPALFLFNKILGVPCFIRNVRTPSAYKLIKSKGLFAVFENIIPKTKNNIKSKRGTL